MSEFLYGKITRGAAHTVIAANFFLQLDKMDAKEAGDYQGVDPHFLYKMTTRQLPTTNVLLVQLGDHVTDTNAAVLDPKTNNPRTYLIISDPQPKALMMTWTWIVERMRGT